MKCSSPTPQGRPINTTQQQFYELALQVYEWLKEEAFEIMVQNASTIEARKIKGDVISLIELSSPYTLERDSIRQSLNRYLEMGRSEREWGESMLCSNGQKPL